VEAGAAAAALASDAGPELAEELSLEGFVLGVLSAASGSDALRARREPRGPALVAGLVERALAARGVELVPAAALLPAAPARLGAGWELPLALGWTLARAGTRLGLGRVDWSASASSAGSVLCVRDAAPACAGALEELAAALAKTAPGLSGACSGADVLWSWPLEEAKSTP
jgi:hypothetical protein